MSREPAVKVPVTLHEADLVIRALAVLAQNSTGQTKVVYSKLWERFAAAEDRLKAIQASLRVAASRVGLPKVEEWLVIPDRVP